MTAVDSPSAISVFRLNPSPEHSAPSWQKSLSRLSIYGDFWPRLLSLAARVTPWFLEPLLLALYSTLFYLACAGEALLRDAVALAARGYRPVAAGGLDQFPHSAHAEWAVTFRRG